MIGTVDVMQQFKGVLLHFIVELIMPFWGLDGQGLSDGQAGGGAERVAQEEALHLGCFSFLCIYIHVTQGLGSK